MHRGIGRAFLLATVLFTTLSSHTVPARAALPVNAAEVVVTGAGTIAPGLVATPVGQQVFDFTGTIFTTGTVHKQTVANAPSGCGAAGLDGLITVFDPNKTKNGWPGDTIANGTGLGIWACHYGPLAGKIGLLYYDRVGPVVVVILTTGNKGLLPAGADHPVGLLECLFVPGTAPPGPIVTYTLTCGGILLSSL